MLTAMEYTAIRSDIMFRAEVGAAKTSRNQCLGADLLLVPVPNRPPYSQPRLCTSYDLGPLNQDLNPHH